MYVEEQANIIYATISGFEQKTFTDADFAGLN